MNHEKLKDRLSRVFDSYELFFLKEKIKKYETKDAELCGVEIKEEEGIALRGIKDNRMIFSYTYDRGDKAIDELVENGNRLLPYMEEEDVEFPGQHKDYPSLNIHDSDGLKVNDEYKTSMLIEMDVADLPGVESVKASVVDGTTVVTFDPSQIDIDAIADQIRKDGYGADIVG